MLYLNNIHKNAGKFNNEPIHKNDIKIEEKINIELLNNLFSNFKILKVLINNHNRNDGFIYGLVLKQTIINIYKNRNNI